MAFAQPGGRGVISGIVVDAASGDPVRKAVVTVTWQGTPRSWATTRTDGSGRFVFEGLPAGKYDLRATKGAFGTAIFGANSVRELGDVITLADGETRGNLTMRFLHSGSISGRVTDHEGDPIQNAEVMVLRSGRNLGERILVNYRAGSTNDRGEYKISSIDPGEYYLLCKPNHQPGMAIGVQEIAVQQYYGGSRDSKSAAPLNLRGGDALIGLDFHLSAEHPATITGRITDVPQLEQPAENLEGGTIGSIPGGVQNGTRFTFRRINGGPAVIVQLSPAEDSQPPWTQNTGAPGPEYRFALPENAPGRYRIQASVRVKDKTYYASQIFDAGPGTNDLVLTMTPAVAVKGHLKVEGPGHPPESFTVALAPPGAGLRQQTYSSPVAKDGSFAIEDVPPGEWLLNINPSPIGVFDKSVRLGDKDYLFKRIEIPPGLDQPLNIVVSSNAATVEGEIDAGSAGADAKRAGILLEPIGQWHTFARFYYSAIADENGKFKVNGVGPGKYKIFAVEKLATSNYRNPESAELLDALGEELEVTEGGNIQAHPKLIPLETARKILKP
jgi:protocatechuate 3,4-dioxygenase beta subunit